MCFSLSDAVLLSDVVFVVVDEEDPAHGAHADRRRRKGENKGMKSNANFFFLFSSLLCVLLLGVLRPAKKEKRRRGEFVCWEGRSVAQGAKEGDGVF